MPLYYCFLENGDIKIRRFSNFDQIKSKKLNVFVTNIKGPYQADDIVQAREKANNYLELANCM